MSVESRITAISPGFDTCAECYARLMIYTGKLDPNEVTNILKVEPTQVNVSGCQVINSRGLSRVVKESAWFLSSEKKVFSKDIRDHIDWVTGELKSQASNLKKIQNLDGIKITLRCVWFSLLGHSGPVLWPEQMRDLADLDLECSFDVYFLDE